MKLENEKQRKLKGLSKAIYIVAKVLRVFLIIGFVGIIIGMITIPIITNKIKVENHTITILDEKVTYEQKDNKIIFRDTNNKDVYTMEDDVNDVNKVLDYLDNNKLGSMVVIIEISLALALVVVCLVYYAMKHIEQLFKNIHDNDTPFIMENALHFRKIGYLLIAILIVEAVSNLTFTMVKSDFALKVDLVNVLFILAFFAFSYIFEYGSKLQEATNGKIYDE